MTDVNEYRYALVVVGRIKARNRAQAYSNVQYGFSLNGRMLENDENNITIEVVEIKPKIEPRSDGRPPTPGSVISALTRQTLEAMDGE